MQEEEKRHYALQTIFALWLTRPCRAPYLQQPPVTSANEDLESSNMSAVILRNTQLGADILFYLLHSLNILSL